MEMSASKGRNFGFQQILEAPAHDLRDQGASGGALHELAQLGTELHIIHQSAHGISSASLILRLPLDSCPPNSRKKFLNES
jgi:hypothetical protein